MSTRTLQIAVLPGDGIGPEVTDEAVQVLESVSVLLTNFHLQLTEYSVGAAEYLRSGNPLPERAFAACRNADAVLLGAMGLPEVRWPNGKEMTPQIDLRERLDLYCGLRPIYLYHADDSPLKNYSAGAIDFLIVRENTEGLFSARLSEHEPNVDEVRDIMRITRGGSERIVRAAFEQARRRRQHVTLVDKANVLPAMVFFRKVFDEVAADFPDVQTDRVYVDAAALFLVTRPQAFDVIVTENMFGDILSDLAAGIVGGMGMAPSADIGAACAIFQPSHGSAPDIAGQGRANPVAMILSVALMCEWLGQRTQGGDGQLQAAADTIRDAVSQVFADPAQRTPDMGGPLSTSDMGRAIRERIG